MLVNIELSHFFSWLHDNPQYMRISYDLTLLLLDVLVASRFSSVTTTLQWTPLCICLCAIYLALTIATASKLLLLGSNYAYLEYLCHLQNSFRPWKNATLAHSWPLHSSIHLSILYIFTVIEMYASLGKHKPWPRASSDSCVDMSIWPTFPASIWNLCLGGLCIQHLWLICLIVLINFCLSCYILSDTYFRARLREKEYIGQNWCRWCNSKRTNKSLLTLS